MVRRPLWTLSTTKIFKSSHIFHLPLSLSVTFMAKLDLLTSYVEPAHCWDWSWAGLVALEIKIINRFLCDFSRLNYFGNNCPRRATAPNPAPDTRYLTSVAKLATSCTVVSNLPKKTRKLCLVVTSTPWSSIPVSYPVPELHNLNLQRWHEFNCRLFDNIFF